MSPLANPDMDHQVSIAGVPVAIAVQAMEDGMWAWSYHAATGLEAHCPPGRLETTELAAFDAALLAAYEALLPGFGKR